MQENASNNKDLIENTAKNNDNNKNTSIKLKGFSIKNIITSLFASIPLSIILMIIYVICIGSATFIESSFGTIVANDVIYKSWQFAALNIWLGINVIGCMILSLKHAKFKLGFQILHLSFVVIIIGASITRIYGYEGIMQIANNESSSFIVSEDKYLNVFINENDKDINPLSAFKKAYDFRLSPYTRNKVSIKDNAFNKELKIESIKTINYSTQNAINEEDLKEKRKENLYVSEIKVSYNNESKTLFIFNDEKKITFILDSHTFVLSWGARQIHLPFSVKLDKFEVQTYPGSNMPSSYASYVEIQDEKVKEPLKYKIYMNHTLDYAGYRFFQSSYMTKNAPNGEMEYTGTILSVNNDPGKIPTYIGYTLLIIGAIIVLFDKKSRFSKLSHFIKSNNIIAIIVCLYAFNMHSLYSNDNTQGAKNTAQNQALNSQEQQKILQIMQNMNKRWESLNIIMNDTSDEAVKKRFESLKNIPQTYIDSFKKLQIQNSIGRIETIDTFSRDLMHKIVKKDSFNKLDSNNFLIGLMVMPQDMRKIRFIKVDNKEIMRILGIEGKYISLNDIFDLEALKNAKDSDEVVTKSYKIYSFVESANRKKEADRNQFDKDILKLNESINYVFPDSIWYYLKIFPSDGNEFWNIANPAMQSVKNKNDMIISSIRGFLINEFLMGISQNDYSNLSFVLDALHKYQKENGHNLYLSDNHINIELLSNKIDIFPISQYIYLFLGFALFITALIAILMNKKINKFLGLGLYIILLCVFALHTAGLIFRWYIGGHAPWSNAYESMLYIAWGAAFAGIIILRKSYLALCGASFLTSMALMVAHWGFMDPQISNLVPVLKSYWLNIHVSVIVASYGFLGLSFMLGIINLILFIFASKSRPQVHATIVPLSVINEMSMIIGILMLTIGTFLGGIWANESWGRYWSWDSKETWSLASIGIYACVLHIRLLKIKYYPYYFNVLSVLAFGSILMTYFGVNYYLSGMHSYAKGTQDIVSKELFIAILCALILIILSFFRRKLEMPKI